MNELALFADAGGGLLASSLLGWNTVCGVELDWHSRCVLIQRQNDGLLPLFPIWDDVRTFDGRPWRGLVDVVSGGFPCQPFSTASSGKNTAEDFWPEMRRIVANVAPSYVFAENVSRKAIDTAADDLEQMGYAVKCIELSASDMGADHIRSRFWLLAHTNMHGKLLRTVDAEMAVMPGIRPRVWDAYTDEPRMANGVAYRMDRLKATGNGQIPCVAATAFRLLGGH
jgi:DNA (cytosine-5)-methyltransferase 1